MMKVDFGGLLVVFMIFVVLAGCVLFVKILVFPLLKQSFEADQLKEINEGFTFKAGGCFDLVNLTYPFVEITLNADSMNIKYSGVNFCIMYNQIKLISVYNGHVSKGFKLEYIELEKSFVIIIWSPYYKQVVNYIQSRLTQG